MPICYKPQKAEGQEGPGAQKKTKLLQFFGSLQRLLNIYTPTFFFFVTAPKFSLLSSELIQPHAVGFVLQLHVTVHFRGFLLEKSIFIVTPKIGATVYLSRTSQINSQLRGAGVVASSLPDVIPFSSLLLESVRSLSDCLNSACFPRTRTAP